MKYYLKLLSLPLTFLCVFISLFFLWEIFNFPPAETLVEKIGVFFDSYGLIVFFISAMIEGMLLFGGYFPGVFVIFVSVLSASSLNEALLRIFIGTLGLMVAHVSNYFLGKYGWYKLLVKFGLKPQMEKEKSKIEKRGPWAIFGSYWLPSLSALTDTAAGILGMPFKIFITFSILSSVFWNLLVGFIVYFTGTKILIIASGGKVEILIQLSIVIIWSIILLIVDYYKKRKNNTDKLR